MFERKISKVQLISFNLVHNEHVEEWKGRRSLVMMITFSINKGNYLFARRQRYKRCSLGKHCPRCHVQLNRRPCLVTQSFRHLGLSKRSSDRTRKSLVVSWKKWSIKLISKYYRISGLSNRLEAINEEVTLCELKHITIPDFCFIVSLFVVWRLWRIEIGTEEIFL